MPAEPVDSEWSQVKSASSGGEQVGLQLPNRAGEFESVSGARARNQNLLMRGMEIDYEVVIGRVREQAGGTLFFWRARQLR